MLTLLRSITSLGLVMLCSESVLEARELSISQNSASSLNNLLSLTTPWPRGFKRTAWAGSFGSLKRSMIANMFDSRRLFYLAQLYNSVRIVTPARFSAYFCCSCSITCWVKILSTAMFCLIFLLESVYAWRCILLMEFLALWKVVLLCSVNWGVMGSIDMIRWFFFYKFRSFSACSFY